MFSTTVRTERLVVSTAVIGAPLSFFFFNDTATTEIYTLSLHDALPIWVPVALAMPRMLAELARKPQSGFLANSANMRSEEHTSELQSPCNLVCRLLLEKKKKKSTTNSISQTRYAKLHKHI